MAGLRGLRPPLPRALFVYPGPRGVLLPSGAAPSAAVAFAEATETEYRSIEGFSVTAVEDEDEEEDEEDEEELDDFEAGTAAEASSAAFCLVALRVRSSSNS